MKKIILSLIAILLLTSCQTPSIDEATVNDFPKIGFRNFWFTRGEDGNLPTITQTDIPNAFDCKQMEREFFDKNFNTLSFVGQTPIQNGEKNKILKLDTDALIQTIDSKVTKSFQDVYGFNITYFCADPRLFLNEDLFKVVSN